MQDPAFDELKKIALAPLQLLDSLLAEVSRISGDPQLGTEERLAQVQKVQDATVREAEEQFKRFQAKLVQEEKKLLDVLAPPAFTPFQQMEALLQEAFNLISKAAFRERLFEQWEEETAATLFADYKDAVERGDAHTAEVYEQSAERVLKRKNEPRILEAFQALRARAQEARYSPEQKAAKAQLKELEKIREEADLMRAVMTSTFRFYEK
jgi:hypothetical protein